MNDKQLALASLIWDVVAIALAAAAIFLVGGEVSGLFGMLALFVVMTALLKSIATATTIAFFTRRPEWILAFGLSCALITVSMTHYHGPMEDFFLFSPLVVDAALMVRKITRKE